ncbi:hypothetical protein ACXGQP_11565 [Enterobacter oligotrophicus]
MGNAKESLAQTKTKPQGAGTPATIKMNDRGYVYFEPATGYYYVLDNETAKAVERENDRIQSLLEQQLKAVRDFADIKEQCLDLPADKALANRYNTLESEVYQKNKNLMDGMNFLEPLKPEDDKKTLILGEIAKDSEKIAELLPIRKSAGKVIYARASLNKKGWTPYIPEQSEQGNKSFIKNRKIDSAELYKQLDNISGKIKKDWDIIDPKEHAGTLSKWAENWNKAAKTSLHKEGEESPDDVFDASAGAQLLRYSAGVGASAEFDPLEGEAQAKIAGSAEFALWEGKTEAKIMFPDREGWFPTIPARNGGFCATGLFRLDFIIGASASVGASVTLELSATFGGKKDDSHAVGVRGAAAPQKPATREENKYIDLTEMASQTQVAAGFRAFAGVECKGEVSGAIMWKEPELVSSKDPEAYKCIAKIALEESYLFGVGMDAIFKIEINNGKFYVNCHAKICWGEGAGGGVSYEVDAGLIIDFLKYVLYLLRDADYQKILNNLNAQTYQAISNVSFLLTSMGEDYVRKISSRVETLARDVEMYVSEKNSRQDFIKIISADEEMCRFTTPEVKGYMLAILTEGDSIDAIIDVITKERLDIKKGVMNIVRWVQSKAEYENIMQHCSLTLGERKYPDWRVKHSRIAVMMYGGEMFTTKGEYVGDDQGNEYGEIFEQIYLSLSDRPMAGYPLLANDSHDYVLARNGINNSYYKSTALV